MATITFITGGARSGKSRFAQQLAEQRSDRPVYLATARVWDDDFAARIRRHRADRDQRWETMEEEKWLARLDLSGRTVVLDCVTLWLTNFFYDNGSEAEVTLEEAKQEWKAFVAQEMDLIVVSNELGMGIHPENEAARKFADLQGWMNQFIAAGSGEVYLMVAGVAVKLR